MGAGVCGLYAARTLVEIAGIEVVVVEKEDLVGGLATGRKFGKNYYDHGVHMLHEFDQEIYDDVRNLMNGEMTDVSLDARIKWMNKIYRYPLQPLDTFASMNPLRVMHFIVGLLSAQLAHRLFPKEAENAEVALIQLYGKPLYKYFFEKFTEKYWDIHPKKLSATFIKSKMPRLTVRDALYKIFSKLGIKDRQERTVESALLEETLHYSKQGAEAMPRCIASYIESKGGVVLIQHEVERLNLSEGSISSVEIRDIKTNQLQNLECDYCISTIPLPEMIQKIKPSPQRELLESSNFLEFRAIAVYGLLVNKTKAMDCLYCYYRNRIFHRVSEPKNSGLKVVPENHTVLLVEMTCYKGDNKWEGHDSIKRQVLDDLESEGLCQPDQVVEINVLTNEHGYPIYSKGFDPHLANIMTYLEGIHNLSSTGRQGGFSYPNMDRAMRLGSDAAQRSLAYFQSI